MRVTVFNHDALSLLTSHEYPKYMKSTHFNDKSAHEKWLIPQNYLNVGTPYYERCVGNSPKFMPLDNSLNYGLKLSHVYHCAVTSHLPDNDRRKHTLATPKRIVENKKWEYLIGAPNPERIVQDVHRAFDAFKIIYEAGGNIVRELANRNGHRNT